MTEPGFQLAQRQAAEYEKQSGRFMGPSARLIVESTGLQASDAVLDLACGTGLVARHAHPLVQPGGRVVSADVNPTMLAAAESLASPGIEWIQAPAETMPFDEAIFTHVICQQGFQFFSDTLAAARETQLALLAELDDTAAASAGAATPSDADDLLRGVATEAGFSDIDLSLLQHSIDIDNIKAFFIDQTATTPWAPVIARLLPEEQNQLAGEFVARLGKREVADGHRLRFCSHMIHCQK